MKFKNPWVQSAIFAAVLIVMYKFFKSYQPAPGTKISFDTDRAINSALSGLGVSPALSNTIKNAAKNMIATKMRGTLGGFYQ